MMSYGYAESIRIKQPSAPSSVGATVTLFDSAAMFHPRFLRAANATMLEVTFHALTGNSDTNGLIAYTSTDGGTTYVQNLIRDSSGTATMPDTVTASNCPTDPYQFVLTPFDDFKLTFTTIDPQTTWQLLIMLHLGGLAVQR